MGSFLCFRAIFSARFLLLQILGGRRAIEKPFYANLNASKWPNALNFSPTFAQQKVID